VSELLSTGLGPGGHACALKVTCAGEIELFSGEAEGIPSCATY